MNIKLKLDRDELKGLIVILRLLDPGITNAWTITEYINSLEIQSMHRKYIMMLMNPKKKYSMPLSLFQTAMLFVMLNKLADNFQPFERSVALNIIAQIDRQYINHRQMMLNFISEDRDNLRINNIENQNYKQPIK